MLLCAFDTIKLKPYPPKELRMPLENASTNIRSDCSKRQLDDGEELDNKRHNPSGQPDQEANDGLVEVH